MHIPDLNARLLQVHRQVLGHFLGQSCHQDPLLSGRAGIDFPNQVIDLPLNGPHLHQGIQQPRGPDDLLHNLAGTGTLILAGSSGDVNHLIDLLIELLEVQWPVVVGGGQTEAIVHQSILPAPVSGVHGPALGQGDVAFVNEHKKIFREIIQQCGRRRSRGPALNDPGIVLNAVAEADFRHHFQVVGGALGNTLGFNELVFRPEFKNLFVAFLLDFQHSPLELIPGGNIMAGGVNRHMVHIALHHAGYGVDLADAIDLVPEKLHPNSPAGPIGRIDLQRVSPDPELISGEVDIVALITDLRQLFEYLIHRPLLAHPQGNDHALVVNGVPQAIQAADGGHDDHIPPLKQRGCG